MVACAVASHTAVMNLPTATQVFIVDDSPLVRTGLRDLLADIDNASVVGEAETPADAIDGILKLKPTCVVLDFQLRSGTAIDVLRTVHPRAMDIVFIVLTNHPTPQYRRLCLAAGAQWFFDKSTEFNKIKDVILSCSATTQRCGPSPSPAQGQPSCTP
jgi:DNA-binding NarL/FixJ family response regulator